MILLGDRRTHVRTTCPRLLPERFGEEVSATKAWMRSERALPYLPVCVARYLAGMNYSVRCCVLLCLYSCPFCILDRISDVF